MTAIGGVTLTPRRRDLNLLGPLFWSVSQESTGSLFLSVAFTVSRVSASCFSFSDTTLASTNRHTAAGRNCTTFHDWRPSVCSTLLEADYHLAEAPCRSTLHEYQNEAIGTYFCSLRQGPRVRQRHRHEHAYLYVAKSTGKVRSTI